MLAGLSAYAEVQIMGRRGLAQPCILLRKQQYFNFVS